LTTQFFGSLDVGTTHQQVLQTAVTGIKNCKKVHQNMPFAERIF